MSGQESPLTPITTAGTDHADAELRAAIRREVHSIRREKLPLAWNDDADYQKDLGLDSLDLVEMVARLEQVTGLFVPDEHIARLTSITATAEYVRARRFGVTGLARSPDEQNP
jgi:acyl carrier protein